MKNSLKTLSTLTLAALTFGAVDLASAHHSFAMFDRSKEEVLSGEVVRWAFNSPHVALYIRDEAGTIFAFEGAAPPRMIESSPSMTGFTFQPGDQVMVVKCPLRDGRNGGAVGLVLKDDIWYDPSDGGCGADSDAWQDWYAKGYTSKQEAMDAGEEVP
ncbi:MAG: DUF6152 family protein [Gammaproteobacteria bacterium]|jgi:hypothetical protein|nr:DUF6152 family protein [Gammaproteobacteria bacterium]